MKSDIVVHEILLRRKKTVSRGAVRYDEVVPDGRNPIINALYIQAWADPKTESIIVTLESIPIDK